MLASCHAVRSPFGGGVPLLAHRTISVCSIVVLVLTTLAAVCVNGQTNLAGRVNQWTEVTAINACDSTVFVTDASSYSPGDRVFLIQMKGVDIVVANDSTYGSLRSLNSAGACEFLTVAYVSGTGITFTSRFANTYDARQRMQLIGLPKVAGDARISGPINARPWDGRTGGVVVLEVPGTLRCDAGIDVSFRGFRGGALGGRTYTCDTVSWDLDYSEQRGGGKGESSVNLDLRSARGRLFTGGGGGNAHNAGGAGGGNGGAGGNGGNAVLVCRAQAATGGRGGVRADTVYAISRLLPGSGGGGGHQNPGDLEGTSGGAGGGLIIIRCGRLDGRNAVFAADGESVTRVAGYDGAGGGGAGGTVLIDAGAIDGAVVVRARGGKGGDIGTSPRGIVYNAHGPGGGGGGGTVILPRASNGVVTELTGGVAGNHLNQENEAFNQRRGATDGSPGYIVRSFTWKSPTSLTLSTSGSVSICPGTTATLSATSGFARYRWSTGDTTQSIRVRRDGTYSVTAVDSGGCAQTVEEIRVSYDPARIDVDTLVDFGLCDLDVPVRRSAGYVNTDDERSVIDSIVVPAPFRLLGPPVPLTVLPGNSLRIDLEFIGTEERIYEDTMWVYFSEPCVTRIPTVLRAEMNPIYVRYSSIDTTVLTGSVGVRLPVYVQTQDAALTLPPCGLQMTLSIDSRLFAITSVTQGTIISDVLDFTQTRRRIVVNIDGISINGTSSMVTAIVGTALSASSKQSIISIDSVVYINLDRVPINQIEHGTLAVEPLCAGDMGLVQFIGLPSMTVSPNPARDDARVRLTLTVKGNYVLTVRDVQGITMFEETYPHATTGANDIDVILPVQAWPVGTYLVSLKTPFGVITLTFQRI